MPIIDKRFLAKLLLALAVFLGGLFGVHAWQAKRIPSALKAQAERAQANGKPDSAVRHLRQYLEFNPDDVEVQSQLAEILRARGGSANELHFLYDRILRNDPKRTAVRKEALLLSLKQARLTDAVTHAEMLLKDDPNNGTLWQQLAAAQAGLRQFDAAKASYETATKVNPKDILGWQRRAQFLAADLKQPGEAAKVVDEMVAALPNDVAAYLTRARLGLMGELDKPAPPRAKDGILADLTKALELAPDHPEALLLRAERLQKHRDIAGAREALARGVAKYPGDQRLVRSLAWLEVNRQNSAGAVAVLEDALPHAKDSLDLLVTLADLLLDTGDVAKVEEIVKKLDRRNSATAKLQAKYLRSRLAMRARKWPEAIELLKGLRTEAVTLTGLETQANMLLASCYQRTNEPDKAIEAYKLITAKDATQVSAFLGLGQLYLNDGRFKEAVKAYEAAVVSPFAPTSSIAFFIRLQALQLDPARSEGWAALEKQLQELAPRFGTNAVEPVLLKAELASIRGDWKQSLSLLKAESAKRPQSVPLWCRLAETTGLLIGVAAGLSVLDEAQGCVPDSAELRLARAKLYAKDPARLRPLELLVTQTDHWSDAEQVSFALGMLEIYDSLGEPNRELWRRVLARRPNDLDTWLTYCRTFPDAATRAEVKPTLDRLHPDWECELASFGKNAFETETEKLLAKDDAGAAKRLKEMSQDPRWAGEPMRRVVRKCKTMNIVKLAQPLIAQQPGGLGWIAEQYDRLGDHEAAINMAKAATTKPGCTIDDWLRLEICDTSDVRQASYKPANLPEAQDAALSAAIMIRQKRVLERDARRTSWDRAYTQSVIAIHQARMDRTAAIAELDDYLGGSLAVADRAWATRTLSMLLVVRGEVSDRERAAKLLTGPVMSEAGASLADRRSTAGVLAGLQRYLDGDTRTLVLNKAIELTEAAAKESREPKDRFVLCRLYKTAGRTQDAVNTLNDLLKADPGNLDYLLAGLDVLVEAKQYDAARGFADRLLQLGAAEYHVIAAVARYEVKTGNAAKAQMLAESYFRSADPMAGDVPRKTLRTAELHEELARLLLTTDKPKAMSFVDSAVAKYDALLPGRAEVLLKVAALLSEAGRADEAFAVIEKQQRSVPAKIVAMAAVTALTNGDAAKHAVKTQAWISAAEAEDAKAVRAVKAEYAMLRNDPATARQIYEAILKDEPRNVAALNNLAWLLAADPATAKTALELLDRAVREIGLTGELLDTRARIRMALGDTAAAVNDASEALRHEKTPLRYFHLALATKSLKPEECEKYFAEAVSRGLSVKMMHPQDRAEYQKMLAAGTSK